MIWLCVKRTSNFHKDRTSESRNSKNTQRLLCSGTKLFITFEFKGSSTQGERERERGTIFLLWFFSSAPPPNKGLREQSKTNRLPPRQVSSQLTFKISQNPPRASGAWRHSHLLAPVSHLGLLWHLWVTRLLCARAWKPVLMLHLTNPCAEPKGSQPN